MIAPSAAEITTAIDQLKAPETFAGNEWILAEQQRELSTAVPAASNDFKAGYELGLQAARVVVAGMPDAKVSF